MLTRRQLGRAALGATAAAATTAATGTRPAEAAAAPFALAPAYQTAWARHQSEEAPQLTQLERGVRLKGGPIGQVDRNGLAIWSRDWWTEGDFEARFTTRRRDLSLAAGDQLLYLLLYFGVQGDGTRGHPKRLAGWAPGTVPYTGDYAQHIRGARVTVYRQFPNDNREIQPAGAAYFKADATKNEVPPDGEVLFPGLRGVTYRWIVRRAGDRVTVSQDDYGTVRTVGFTSPAFSRYAAGGAFGLLVPPGREVDVLDFRVS